ncbi:MAG: hypothetical protein WC610_00675 [Patescibacteria group bacterium]
MATKKKNNKKSKVNLERGIEEIKRVGDGLMDKARELKGKYDKLDDKTKKKIAVGLAGAAALVVGMGAIKKRRGRKK